jgi:hypothetical protein
MFTVFISDEEGLMAWGGSSEGAASTEGEDAARVLSATRVGLV